MLIIHKCLCGKEFFIHYFKLNFKFPYDEIGFLL